MNLQWAAAARPVPGQTLSGDAYAVLPFEGGALVAVIGALGESGGAWELAQAAMHMLEEEPSAPVDAQLLRCHERLQGTLGVAMSVARFDTGRSELSWSGVGEVAGVLVRKDPAAAPRRQRLQVFGGVVGGTLAGIRTATLPLHRGDVMLFATDGMKPDFGDDSDLSGDPKVLADRVLHAWGRATEAALVLVLRWLGGPR